MNVGLRIPAAVIVLALVPTAGAAAATGSSASWAAPQIRTVVSAGLMGTHDPATFRPKAPLTQQTLANLVLGLQQILFPPSTAVPPPPTPVTDPVQTTTVATTTTAPTTTAPTTTFSTTTTSTTTTTPTTTTAATVQAPKVADGTSAATMATLDAQLVEGLGLSGAAAEFTQGAQAAGLQVPSLFGTEVVARLLGLRLNHPANQDGLELLPSDPATRAEAAYSAAKVLQFPSWQLPALQALADSFSLPSLSTWQKRILDTAVARIGMPYVWGGTNDGREWDFGVFARGGYDCSGFVWRVYKLTAYPGEGNLASAIRGRTTYVMSAEVPKSELIGFADLQPADLVFFGAHGARSKPSEVDHVGIYIGNGWFINSSESGVALAQLTGWNRTHFAWGRRPLAEAGLAG
jgi:cell wall-associated NlpC family hydrolase